MATVTAFPATLLANRKAWSISAIDWTQETPETVTILHGFTPDPSYGNKPNLLDAFYTWNGVGESAPTLPAAPLKVRVDPTNIVIEIPRNQSNAANTDITVVAQQKPHSLVA